mmetsp:Transcript_45321/g.106772  ORF Transcript_45321/g.106772 Transcript_45321/m.106772 type:complete len:242 (+) Transcript_45321:1071-1796(+)
MAARAASFIPGLPSPLSSSSRVAPAGSGADDAERTPSPLLNAGNSTNFLHSPLCPSSSFFQCAFWHAAEQYTATLHRPQTNGFFPSGVGVPHSKQTDSSNRGRLALNSSRMPASLSVLTYSTALRSSSAPPVLRAFSFHLLASTAAVTAFLSFCSLVSASPFLTWSSPRPNRSMVRLVTLATAGSTSMRMLSHSLLPSMMTFLTFGTPFTMPSLALWWRLLLRTVTWRRTSYPMKIPCTVL